MPETSFIKSAKSLNDIKVEIARLNSYFDFVDDGIREIVVTLNINGYKTFQSCQGGEGHHYQYPTVEFEGDEFDLIRAFDLLLMSGFKPVEAQRVYNKEPLDPFDTTSQYPSNYIWEKPFNRIVL